MAAGACENESRSANDDSRDSLRWPLEHESTKVDLSRDDFRDSLRLSHYWPRPRQGTDGVHGRPATIRQRWGVGVGATACRGIYNQVCIMAVTRIRWGSRATRHHPSTEVVGRRCHGLSTAGFCIMAATRNRWGSRASRHQPSTVVSGRWCHGLSMDSVTASQSAAFNWVPQQCGWNPPGTFPAAALFTAHPRRPIRHRLRHLQPRRQHWRRRGDSGLEYESVTEECDRRGPRTTDVSGRSGSGER